MELSGLAHVCVGRDAKLAETWIVVGYVDVCMYGCVYVCMYVCIFFYVFFEI